jgi:arylsulfatase A-like enzyme
MADDMGYGETGYYGHPLLKTPNLDEMAKAGIRLDRFYAGAPNCSPTRATVLTGRSNHRTGVLDHGYPIDVREVSLAELMRKAGYTTAHFGKWHLNGVRGPGVPVLETDRRNPGKLGFEYWLSMTNFFDLNPIMSNNGNFQEFIGDSSNILVNEALAHISSQKNSAKPFFIVIWYSSPHDPWRSTTEDMLSFAHLDENSKNHYGEMVELDRSIGKLRKGLRDLDVADNTLVWFNSDNGGMSGIKPSTVGSLRGYKNSVYEGGLRVPAIIEWPAKIERARASSLPISTLDIAPTIAGIVGLPQNSLLTPIDGINIFPLLEKGQERRGNAIPVKHRDSYALISDRFKLVSHKTKDNKLSHELYDLIADPDEVSNIAASYPKQLAKMQFQLEAWNNSIKLSTEGADYASPADDEQASAKPLYWWQIPEYQKYYSEFSERPEYKHLFKKSP